MANAKGSYSFLQGWLAQLERAQDQLELEAECGLWQRFVNLVDDALQELEARPMPDDDMGSVDTDSGGGRDAVAGGPAARSAVPTLGSGLDGTMGDVGGPRILRRSSVVRTDGGG